MSKRKVTFAQLVIGPPGSGKSTYCAGMKQFLTTLGRETAVVNLDPANDSLPYDCDVNIADLITLEDVMNTLKLGPNGGLVYCLEFLEKNLEWLKAKLNPFEGKYILIDCPGQVELYTHHKAVRNITLELQKWNYRVKTLEHLIGYELVAIHLVDSHYCSDAGKFVSVLLTSLNTMLQIELPHINILSKIDLIESYGKLAFNLDFYTEVLDLTFLLDHLNDNPIFSKYKELNAALVGIVEDYGLVHFTTLNIQDKQSVHGVLKEADKANGYVFGDKERDTLESLMSTAMGADFQYMKNAATSENLLS